MLLTVGGYHCCAYSPVEPVKLRVQENNPFGSRRIAAIVPCHNEELTVGKVVSDLRAALPGADIYVYANNCSDNTAEVAREAGAIVRFENRPGKGNVIRRAFADVDADIYLIIDGDDTYEAADAPAMVQTMIDGNYDHVLGVRTPTDSSAYRTGHESGNRAFNVLTSWMFRDNVTDMLSGFRVFSRRFVKSFPAVSRHFEIETELTVHTMSLRLPNTEYPVGFRDRPEGSFSKLSTFKDGFRILGLITQLTAHERPRLFYGGLTALFALISLLLGIPVVWEFFQTGYVPRLPTAMLSAGCMILAFLMGSVGIIMDGVRRARRETSRLHYLELPAPGNE